MVCPEATAALDAVPHMVFVLKVAAGVPICSAAAQSESTSTFAFAIGLDNLYFGRMAADR